MMIRDQTAREVARELSARVALGFDVAEEKKERKAEFLAKLNEDNNGKTVADIVNSFYEQLIFPRHKRPEQIRQNIDKDIIPKLGKLKLKKVTASDIDNMIKSIVARGAPATANDVLSLIKRIFSYAIRRRYMENNPAISLAMSA